MKIVKNLMLIAMITTSAALFAANPAVNLEDLVANARAQAQATLDLLRNPQAISDLVNNLQKCNIGQPDGLNCPALRRQATDLALALSGAEVKSAQAINALMDAINAVN